nr:MAK10-like protein [Tanacetum cinerariifolium]
MENENHIRTLEDYSKPSHEGYQNTIELLDGNNVVPLRSDTIRLVQNECSFHRLRSDDPNQQLKDFLKLVDSLYLDVSNRERTARIGRRDHVGSVSEMGKSCVRLRGEVWAYGKLAGSENHPPMLNKENYVPWSSRLLRYAKSRPNGKLIHNSIINDDELTKKELKQIEADDQAIQTILLGLKFLNNLQPEWSRHVTIVHQTKELHTADYTQLYDFLKYNQKEVDELKAERLTKTQDPLALMATSNNPYNFPVPRQDQPSFNQNYMQQPIPNPEYITGPTTAMNMALALMAKAF